VISASITLSVVSQLVFIIIIIIIIIYFVIDSVRKLLDTHSYTDCMELALLTL
jgi:hypothetical protein